MRLKNLYIAIALLFASTCWAQEIDLDKIYLNAVAEIAKGNPDTAIQEINQLLSNKKDVEFFELRAKALTVKGDYLSAIEDYSEINRVRSNSADLELAKCYARLGDLTKTLEYLESHLKSRYKKDEADVKLDAAFKKFQENKAWIDFWNRDWYSSREKETEVVKYLIKYGKYSEALGKANEALKSGKRNHRMYALRGQTYAHLKNHPKAVDDYSTAIKLYSRDSEYYELRAKSYQALGKYRNALEDIGQVLEYEPQRIDLYLIMVELHVELDQEEEAVKAMHLYLELFPEQEKALYQAGEMYLHFERPLDALLCLNKCLEKSKAKPEYYVSRGNAYLMTKTYKYAIMDYAMALDLDPSNPEVYVNKGLARKAMGDNRGACSDWERASKMGSRKAMEFILEHCQ